MDKQLDITRANIENLTALWRTASLPFNGYFEKNGFNYCAVAASEWPNRLWFTRDIDRELITAAQQATAHVSTGLVLPYWDIYNSGSSEILDTMGFERRSEQIGMSLKLGSAFPEKSHLTYELVNNHSAAKLWTAIFSSAFGYLVNDDILLHTGNEIKYYLAFHQGQPVGTAILYITDNIAGIHSVGIIPEMRRQGLAGDIMHFILNKAIQAGAEYATLQASAMGKGLYFQLGFTEEFRIKNYLFANKKAAS